MLGHERLLGMMVNTPILAHPRKAAVVYSVLRRKAGLSGIQLPEMDSQRIDALFKPEKGASQFIGSQPQSETPGFPSREPYRLDQGVAIISVLGSMVNRGAWVGDDGSGLYSMEGIKFQLARAKADSRVSSVILDIETPGGQAMGAMEMAAAVRDLAATKPVYSVVNGMAASGGYALASGSTRIITTPSGLTGSIGVVMLHLDESAKLEAEGITATLIYAGDHKVDGNGIQPLTDQVKAELQQEVKDTYDLFLTTVAKGRGDRLTKAKARDTQARTFMGKDAVDVGLADAVGTFEDVLSEAQAKARRAQGKSKSNGSKANMSVLGNDDQGGTTTQQASTAGTFTQADLDKAVADALAKAGGSAQTEAQKLAAQRLDKITSDPQVTGARVAAAVSLAAKNPEMPAEDVVSFVVAHVPGQGEAAPEPKPGQGTIAERAAAGNVSTVHGGPVGDNPARPGGETAHTDVASQAGWKKAKAAQERQYMSGLSQKERAAYTPRHQG